jgi:hypothetical protein
VEIRTTHHPVAGGQRSRQVRHPDRRGIARMNLLEAVGRLQVRKDFRQLKTQPSKIAWYLHILMHQISCNGPNVSRE